MNFSEAMFYEHYLTLDFHTDKHCYFKTSSLPTRQNGVENSDKAYLMVLSTTGPVSASGTKSED